MDLSGIIVAIPDAVWGAFVGGASAVAVVVVQLWHDRKVRRREREFTVKRDIYLQAAEALASAQGFFSNVGRLDLSQQEQLSALQGNPGWLNKVHVVATQPTIDSLVAVGDYFIAASFELFEIRFEVERLDSQIQQLEQQRDELGRYQGYLASIASGAPPPMGSPSSLATEIETSRERFQSILDELDNLIDQRLATHVRLTRLCAKHSVEFQKLLIPATLAIRREIGMDIDPDGYRLSIEASSSSRQQQFDQFFTELDRKFGPESENTG